MRSPRALRHLSAISTRCRRPSTPTRCISSQPIFPPPPLVVPDEDDSSDPGALRHIHLQSDDEMRGGEFTPYTAASTLQASLRHTFLDWKKSAPTSRADAAAAAAPSPLVISFTPTPTYTLGKRQKSLGAEQLARLKQPLSITLDNGHVKEYTPQVIETDRGGLTTYHGPGQVVLWPILDLRSGSYLPQTVRSYARLLEETTQAVLADGPGVATYLSEEDPGVWSSAARCRAGRQERKIAAMGVHLRRHISGLGTAVNVDVVVDGDERVNPWARFVPCGLEGKTVTSVRAEVGLIEWERWRDAGDERTRTEWYARRWVMEFAVRLGVKVAE